MIKPEVRKEISTVFFLKDYFKGYTDNGKLPFPNDSESLRCELTFETDDNDIPGNDNSNNEINIYLTLTPCVMGRTGYVDIEMFDEHKIKQPPSFGHSCKKKDVLDLAIAILNAASSL